MENTKLLKRLVAQNEAIMQQNIELLLAVSALLEEHFKGNRRDGSREDAALSSARWEDD